MHELAIARSIVEIASAAADEAGAGRVTAVRVRIGALTAVVPEALNASYEVASRGTLLEGSSLDVSQASAVIHCSICRRQVELPDLTRFACPVCGMPGTDLRGGRELEVESIEVI